MIFVSWCECSAVCDFWWRSFGVQKSACRHAIRHDSFLYVNTWIAGAASSGEPNHLFEGSGAYVEFDLPALTIPPRHGWDRFQGKSAEFRNACSKLNRDNAAGIPSFCLQCYFNG